MKFIGVNRTVVLDADLAVSSLEDSFDDAFDRLLGASE